MIYIQAVMHQVNVFIYLLFIFMLKDSEGIFSKKHRNACCFSGDLEWEFHVSNCDIHALFGQGESKNLSGQNKIWMYIFLHEKYTKKCISTCICFCWCKCVHSTNIQQHEIEFCVAVVVYFSSIVNNVYMLSKCWNNIVSIVYSWNVHAKFVSLLMLYQSL